MRRVLPKPCLPERLVRHSRGLSDDPERVEVIMDTPRRRRTTKKVVHHAARCARCSARTTTDRDIVRRAYERYEKRGRQHGHDLNDWRQAERELQDALNATGASLLAEVHHSARTRAQSYPHRVS